MCSAQELLHHELGSANRETVEAYVARQATHHAVADPRLQATLDEMCGSYPTDLSQVRSTGRGLYVYNLHLVVVNAERGRLHSEQELRAFLQCVEKSAVKHGERLSKIGIVPDHGHWTLGCLPDRSPQEIALSYMNNLAFTFGMRAQLSYGYYAGTIGEYDLQAIRRRQ